MSKRTTKTNRTANHGDFAGPDADKENLDRLAAAKAEAEAGAGPGHNSGDPSPDAITRSYNAIKAAKLEIIVAGRTMQKARAELSAAEKTAKADLGSKGWVSSVKKSVEMDMAAEKGGQGELVTEHRQIGVILRTLNVPLGTQFGLFAEPPVVAAPAGEAAVVSEVDAYLQGEHAYKNEEPLINNPFQPGTPQHVQWGTGWADAQTANVNGTEFRSSEGTREQTLA